MNIIIGSMINQLFSTRHRVLLSVVVLYLIPVILISGYAHNVMPQEEAWRVLALGLLIGVTGSLAIFILMQGWEKTFNEGLPVPEKSDNIQEAVQVQTPQEIIPSISQEAFNEIEAKYNQTAQDLIEREKKIDLLEAQLEKKLNEIIDLNKDKERLQRQSEQILRDFNQFKDSSEEKFAQTRIFLGEYQQTISEQRLTIESKQQLVGQLEAKVRDLTYEIKTLLQLAETAQAQTHPTPPLEILQTTEAQPSHSYKTDIEDDSSEIATAEKQVITEEEALLQLKRCVDIAQKITGANHYTSRLSRLKDLPMDNYALDLRRLFDSLRSENSATVIVYSQKENKLLFVNNQVKGMLGWGSDKFIQSFSEIIEEDTESWKNLVSQLAYKNDSKARLLMKSKSGQSFPVNCHLGVIPTGIFRSNILGVLYRPAP